jgi:putative N6-adenine-specific DNA methylase
MDHAAPHAACDATAQRSPLRSLNFAALRIKDAACDAMREATGERRAWTPGARTCRSCLHLGPSARRCMSTARASRLFKRGWREDKGDAPLKETLAAAMLAAAGWRARRGGRRAARPLLRLGHHRHRGGADRVRHRTGPQAPLRLRAAAAFRRSRGARASAALRSQAQARIRPCAVPIVASDVSFRMVDFARRNARARRRGDCIDFHGGDRAGAARARLAADLPGTLMLNPPYGERIEVAGKAGARTATTRRCRTDFFAAWPRTGSAPTRSIPPAGPRGC